MNKYEIIKKIEQFAPVETAEAWDCVGFMVETKKTEVSKVMLCLTVTEDVVRQAKLAECDIIISHHPLFVVKTPLSFESSRQNFCAVSDSFSPLIDIYSAHTNLDKANGGTTDTLIKTLGLDEFRADVCHDFLRMVDFGRDISLEEFSQKLLKVSPNARLVNNKKVDTLRRVAFCAGSGSEFIEEAKTLGAEALVTGDLKFHTALDSEIVLYDIGHFESEILVLPVLRTLIGEGVEVVFAQEESPFQSII